MTAALRTETLRHGKVELALHHLRAATDDTARPLLLLHGLGEQSPTEAPEWTRGWPGAIVALDFTGHGASTLPRGGGYTAELLLGDADIALAALTDGDPERSITVAGRGLGAYTALQLAGARASQVLKSCWKTIDYDGMSVHIHCSTQIITHNNYHLVLFLCVFEILCERFDSRGGGLQRRFKAVYAV